MKTRELWGTVVVMVGLGPAFLLGDQAEDTFKSVFGPDLQRVTQTRETDDDVDLAKRLLKSAGQASNEPRLVVLLLENAYTLGMKHPSGFETAQQAALRLRELPESADAALEKLLAVRVRQVNMASGVKRGEMAEELAVLALEGVEAKVQARRYGEAAKLLRQAMAAGLSPSRRTQVVARLREVGELERAVQQAASLRHRLKAEPSDEAARLRLLQMLVVDLDDPRSAADVLTRDCDERYRTYLPLVIKEGKDLADIACMELGDWYRSLADSASQAARPAMLRRAKTYYDLYLEKHAAVDAARMKADMTAKQIAEELAKSGETPKPADTWVDLMAAIDPIRDASGSWQSQQGALTYTQTDLYVGTVKFPVTPKGPYDIQMLLEIGQPVYGPMSFELRLPVSATRGASLEFRLSKDAWDSVHEVDMPRRLARSLLTPDSKALIEVRVLPHNASNIEIIVFVNKRPHFTYKGSLVRLAIPSSGVEPRAPTLRVHRGGLTIKSAKFRMISGTYEKVGQEDDSR